MRDGKLRRQLRRVGHGRVVLFIGLEDVRLGQQAERLAQQPVAARDIALADRVVRLVAQAGELLPALQRGGKAELQQLRAADVKERHVIAAECRRHAVMNVVIEDARADMLKHLLLQHQLADDLKALAHGLVAVDVQFALVLARVHHRRDLAQHPDHAVQVIRMRVRDEQVVHRLKAQLRVLHLAQDAVAAARVHQQRAMVVRDGKAGIVAAGRQGIACAQHGQLFHCVFLL